jgi:hypothetical protein
VCTTKPPSFSALLGDAFSIPLSPENHHTNILPLPQPSPAQPSPQGLAQPLVSIASPRACSSKPEAQDGEKTVCHKVTKACASASSFLLGNVGPNRYHPDLDS